MKTKILQEKLQSALSQVEKITGKDVTLPILSNILLRAEKNSLTAIATNLETGISWKLLSKTEENGDVVLPAQTLSNLIGSFPGGSVSIESKNNAVAIINDRRKSNLNSLSSDEFPALPINTEGDYLTIKPDLLCQALAQIVGFVSVSSIKPEITGVYLSFLKEGIKIVATDSFRLGEKTITGVKLPENLIGKSIIIPLRAVREIISIFNDKKNNVNFFVVNNQINIDFSAPEDADQPQIQFVSRLIEGDFPDYQAIIPTSYVESVVFSKKELLNQLKSASLFSGKNNEVGIKIEQKELLMLVSSLSADLGGYDGEMKVEGASGRDVSIIFNCRFLVEGLNSIKDDKCIFEFSSDDGPGVLKSAGDLSFIYILMPIKKY
ncbi:MAG: DNA polymerase III subunit beta [Candidatus Paceibacterota bacterium]